jgi:pre-mRNA-processing factor 19
LADNGGSDPFTNQPLDETQLVTLASQGENIIPPRPSASSMPSLLKLLNSEYSNLILELFDARQLLEETRKELSQSLYQNDAAVRVIARLSMERDAARQELISYKASVSSAPAPVAPVAVDDTDDMPVKKRVRPTDDKIVPRSIPQDHVDIMTRTWQELSQIRKAEKKQLAANAPTVESLAAFQEVDRKSYHKTRGKQGIVAMASTSAGLIVTAGRDKQVCVYNGEQVSHTYSVGECTLVDVLQDLVAVGTSDNTIALLQGDDERFKVTLTQQIVGIHLHPSQQHFVVTTTVGVHMYSMTGEALAFFESTDGENTCAALHPDGLLHAVGTSTGKLCLWDFKSQKLASTLTSGDAPLASIAFSNNGYHVATISDKLIIWDLKKQAVLKELESKVAAVTFDPSGKFVAYAVPTSLVIASVKELSPICTIDSDSVCSLNWITNQVVAASSKERAVKFYGTTNQGNL